MNYRIYYLFLIVALSSCNAYDFVIESDYSYEGNFSRYKTFNFAINDQFKGSEEDKFTIEKYLGNTLQAWGYNVREKKPDLIVFYTVYYEDLVFNGYNQPQFQGWLRSNYHEKAVVFKKDTLESGELIEESVDRIYNRDENYDRINYTLREGTLLISLFDPRRKLTVWQGYASGVFGENQMKNERVMRSAVIQILDEFKLTAFGTS